MADINRNDLIRDVTMRLQIDYDVRHSTAQSIARDVVSMVLERVRLSKGATQ